MANGTVPWLFHTFRSSARPQTSPRKPSQISKFPNHVEISVIFLPFTVHGAGTQSISFHSSPYVTRCVPRSRIDARDGHGAGAMGSWVGAWLGWHGRDRKFLVISKPFWTFRFETPQISISLILRNVICVQGPNFCCFCSSPACCYHCNKHHGFYHL